MPFTTRLLVTPATDRSWRLAEPLVYEGAVDTWRIPAGYVTDYASVPPVAAWLIPTYGRWTRAAIVHDYLITEELPAGRITPNDLDGVFRRILRELGVSTPRRWLMWAGVRWGSLFGGRADGWASTALPVLAISLAALPGLLVGGLGVLLGSIPLTVAEWFSPSQVGPPEPGTVPTMAPRALINHEALRAEADRRREADALDRRIDDLLSGPQPVDMDRVRDLIDRRVDLDRPDHLDDPERLRARADLLRDAQRVDTVALAEAERLTGHSVHWDGSVLRYRDGTPVDLTAAREALPEVEESREQRAAAVAYRLGGTTWWEAGILWWGRPSGPLREPVDVDALETLADIADHSGKPAAAREVVADAAAALREPVEPDEFERRAAAAADRLGATTWRRDGVLWWGKPGEPGTAVDLDVIEAAADAAYLRNGGA